MLNMDKIWFLKIPEAFVDFSTKNLFFSSWASAFQLMSVAPKAENDNEQNVSIW